MIGAIGDRIFKFHFHLLKANALYCVITQTHGAPVLEQFI